MPPFPRDGPRIAAEILLRFYEDLARADMPSRCRTSRVPGWWHPLVERLTFMRETLDEDLVALGISPIRGSFLR